MIRRPVPRWLKVDWNGNDKFYPGISWWLWLLFVIYCFLTFAARPVPPVAEPAAERPLTEMERLRQQVEILNLDVEVIRSQLGTQNGRVGSGSARPAPKFAVQFEEDLIELRDLTTEREVRYGLDRVIDRLHEQARPKGSHYMPLAK
jgi:hypothetical protein